MIVADLMAWTRGSKDDFDRYAAVSEDDGWSWDAIEPYFKKVGTTYIGQFTMSPR